MVFLVSTTLVAIMKRENGQGGGNRRVQEETKGMMDTYKLLFSIIKLPTVCTFCLLLLTAKVHARRPRGSDSCRGLNSLLLSLRSASPRRTR